MLERRRRLPSPALVIASLALILAVGGGGFALAISTQKVKKVAKKQANKRITARAAGLSVAHAGTADTATNATDASQLGGVPASGYTRSDCNSSTGQLKGWARIVPSQLSHGQTFSTDGVDLSYNCSGQPVEARRFNGMEVRFDDSPVRAAGATVMYAPSEQQFINLIISVKNEDAGLFRVDTATTDGGESDQPFLIMAP